MSLDNLIKTWEQKMMDYRDEADNSKSKIQHTKAISKFFAYRDCIKELKKQLQLGVVISRFPDLEDFVTEKHNKTEWVKTLPNKYDKEIYYGAGFSDCYDWIKELLKNDLQL